MLVRIAFTRSFPEAGRIQSLLEAGGFHPLPVDSSSHLSVGGTEQGYYVEIPRTEAKAATEFLRQEGLGKSVIS